MTQTALSAFTGYSVRTVQHWEAGTRIPHASTQEAVLRRIQENARALAQPGGARLTQHDQRSMKTKTLQTENVPAVVQPPLVLDLPAERQELLKAYAEGCYDRGVRIGLLRHPIPRPQWVANCMQDALNHIGTTESWERIESVVSLQNTPDHPPLERSDASDCSKPTNTKQ